MFKSLKNKSKIRQYYVFKNWSFTEATLSTKNLIVQTGISGSGTFLSDQESKNNDNSYKRLIYSSIKRLYYPNYVDHPEVNSKTYHINYGNMEQLQYSTRSIDTQVSVLNIPKNVFGEKIKLKSVTITSNSIDYIDDGYYNIKTPIGNTIGNIFYETGHIIITSGSYLNLFDNFSISFKGTQKITEFEAICDIKKNEFNYTSNVTAFISGADYIGEFTSSELTPYITKIGLYDDYNNLLVIGKVPRPVEKTNKLDMSFVIKMDM